MHEKNTEHTHAKNSSLQMKILPTIHRLVMTVWQVYEVNDKKFYLVLALHRAWSLER